tara:strand:+ start:1564 stop:1788 length:225 start_codon:yes stop_codon:yes gene_type:complete
MPYQQNILDQSQLQQASKSLTVDQLETACAWVQELINERGQRVQQQLGERHQKEMRAQMAKAGISWEEFQKALK